MGGAKRTNEASQREMGCLRGVQYRPTGWSQIEPGQIR